MAKEIYLTRGFVTVVDDEDFEWASRFSWSAVRGRNNCFYANRHAKVLRPDGSLGKTSRQMQRDLLDPEMKLPRSTLVDHRDKDTLNNQRYNLRLVDFSTSNRNRAHFRNNTTGYRWVFFDRGLGRFYVQVKVRGRVHLGGRFDDRHLAAQAANELAIKLVGSDAVLNVVGKPHGG